jgi:hypothetical protein
MLEVDAFLALDVDIGLVGLPERLRGDVDHSAVDIHELRHGSPSLSVATRAEEAYTPGCRLKS